MQLREVVPDVPRRVEGARGVPVDQVRAALLEQEARPRQISLDRFVGAHAQRPAERPRRRGEVERGRAVLGRPVRELVDVPVQVVEHAVELQPRLERGRGAVQPRGRRAAAARRGRVVAGRVATRQALGDDRAQRLADPEGAARVDAPGQQRDVVGEHRPGALVRVALDHQRQRRTAVRPRVDVDHEAPATLRDGLGADRGGLDALAEQRPELGGERRGVGRRRVAGPQPRRRLGVVAVLRPEAHCAASSSSDAVRRPCSSR